MVAAVIDGKRIAAEVRRELMPRIEALKGMGVTPGLAAVIVGGDPASVLYVKMKSQASEEMGLHSITVRLPEDTPEPALLEEVRRLNEDPAVHGILVQQPLPPQISPARAVA